MRKTEQRIDWVIVILMALIVFSPALAMAAADWADELDLLWSIALVGMAAGLIISISRFRSMAAHGTSFVYGLAWITFLLAAPLPYVLWRDRLLNLYGRVGEWVVLALRGGTGRDELIFIFLLGLLFWWLGYSAMWNTVRHQRVWRALLPPGVALLINLYYYVGPKLTPYLMIYLMCALLAIVRSYTMLQERRWLNEHIGYNSDVRFDLLRSGLVLASAAILLAWVAPTAATNETALQLWQRVEGPWRNVEDSFNRMFSTLRSNAQVYTNPFGRTLTLRGPRVLTNTPVLQVNAPQGRRYYWRGVVYDRYTGSGWINTDSNAIQLDAEREGQQISFDAREEITQTFTLFLPANTLVFAAQQPRQVSVPVRADIHATSDGLVEISQMISTKSLTKGATYLAVSALSMADIESLRSAGTAYPAWVLERYLQLPEELPASVRTQAQEIAGGLATPYDQAAAIEAWLRANVVYDDKTPAPPQSQDAVEYVLSVRRGYCDYYASAMVVMLRSLGVPARLTVGYAQGKYDSSNGVYQVTEQDSHSWVEVFFPQYGWIEFEPTAAQPVIDRPKPEIAGNAPAPEPSSSQAGAVPTRTPRDREPEEAGLLGGSSGGIFAGGRISGWGLGLGILTLALAAVFLILMALERYRPKSAVRVVDPWLKRVGLAELVVAAVFVIVWGLGQLRVGRLNLPAAIVNPLLALAALAQVLVAVAFVARRFFEGYGLGGLSPAARIYARLLRFSGWLRVQWNDSQTPNERGAAFALAVPDAHGLIFQVTDDYAREQYSLAPPREEGIEQVWQDLAPRLWLAGLRLRAEWFRRRVDNSRQQLSSFLRRLNSQFEQTR